MSDHIRTAIENGVLKIQINRPEKKNALTQDMYHALSDAINAADSDSSVRVLLLHGTEDCFTAGNDLKDFMAASQSGDQREGPTPPMKFLSAISQAKKPIVAAVTGPAVGIGTTMLLHCDLVVAGENTAFQLPFVNLGCCAEGASSLLLPMMAGHARAAELLLLGDRFSAQTAKEIGLVNRVCAESELLATAMQYAKALSERPPRAVRATKALMKRSTAKPVAETMVEEFRQFGELLMSPEAKEAFTAFFERRKPDFSKFA